MNGEMEYGSCDVCGAKDVAVSRKYYYYDIKCECHSPTHFEIVWYCEQCKDKVKPPIRTTIKIKPIGE